MCTRLKANESRDSLINKLENAKPICFHLSVDDLSRRNTFEQTGPNKNRMKEESQKYFY